MKELGKLRTVCNELDRYNIQVLRICEFNWNEYGSFKTEDNKTVLFSGKEEGTYIHGVALILAKNLMIMLS